MSRRMRLSLACLFFSLVSISPVAQTLPRNQQTPSPNCALKSGDTRIDCTPAGLVYPPQGPFDIPFVRDGQGNNVDDDVSYAKRVSKYVGGKGERYQSADVVMQQCHGGGFLDAFAAFGPPEHTFSSSTRWDQESINYDENVTGPPPPAPGLENFTRAWRDFGQTFPMGGMVNLFNGASSGQLPVIQDAYSPGGCRCTVPPTCPAGAKKSACEYPQYESPDKPYGRNDLRELGDGRAWNIGRQFVILVAWDKPEPRHAANILRMWTLLARQFNVPGGHIVILYNSPAPATIGPFPVLTPPFPGWGNGDPAGLQAVVVDATNGMADWDKALSGAFFLDANGKLAQTRPGDRLLIYNTGHGGLEEKALGEPSICPPARCIVMAQTPVVEYVALIQYGLSVSLTDDPNEDSSITDVSSNGSYSDSIQLTFNTMNEDVPPGTQLWLDGTMVGTFGVDILPSMTADPPVNGPPGAVYYRLQVDPHILAPYPGTVTIDLVSASSQVDPTLLELFNVDFRGGDQEFLADMATN